MNVVNVHIINALKTESSQNRVHFPFKRWSTLMFRLHVNRSIKPTLIFVYPCLCLTANTVVEQAPISCIFANEVHAELMRMNRLGYRKGSTDNQ